jgi:hypothetical protein
MIHEECLQDLPCLDELLHCRQENEVSLTTDGHSQDLPLRDEQSLEDTPKRAERRWRSKAWARTWRRLFGKQVTEKRRQEPTAANEAEPGSSTSLKGSSMSLQEGSSVSLPGEAKLNVKHTFLEFDFPERRPSEDVRNGIFSRCSQAHSDTEVEYNDVEHSGSEIISPWGTLTPDPDEQERCSVDVGSWISTEDGFECDEPASSPTCSGDELSCMEALRDVQPSTDMQVLWPNAQQVVCMPGAWPSVSYDYCNLSVEELTLQAAALDAQAAALKAAALRKIALDPDKQKQRALTQRLKSGPVAKGKMSQPEVPVVHCEEYTTIMLRHLPADFTRGMLLELLDSRGFANSYDFVYLLFDFGKWHTFGYAFVNLTSHQEALRTWQCFSGFTDWPLAKTGSPKACEVCWGNPIQGLAAHVERYRNSPVMHKDVPEEFRPLLFADGVRIEFPAPTKRIRLPRLKHGNPAHDASKPIRGSTSDK